MNDGIFHDYLTEKPRLTSFFAQSSVQRHDWNIPAREWAPSLAQAIRQYQGRIGASSAFRGDEAVIATGQQPGLLTGPLYTIYKAITAIRLARELTALRNMPCVPVFWLATDDHDFEEARTARVLNKNGQPLVLTYAPETDVRGLPLHRVPVESSLHAIIDRAASETRGSEFRQEIAAFLHESLDASDSFADWTARIMARLFEGSGLVFFAAHLPEARRAAAPIMERALQEPLAVARLANEAARELEALGYEPQVRKHDHECAFFIETEGKRQKVVFAENRFHVGSPPKAHTREAMAAFLRAEPECFSPNALWRPIVQQHLFPVVAYVGGPGEIAYWAQLKPVFTFAELPMPAVYPRAQALLITEKLSALRKICHVSLHDLMGPPDALMEKALRASAESDAIRRMRAHRKRIEEALRGFAQDMGSSDRHAAELAEKFRQTALSRLDRLERALLTTDKARVATVRARLERLGNALAPERKPQERAYCVASFLFEYGWELVPRLIETLDIESFHMNEVEL